MGGGGEEGKLRRMDLFNLCVRSGESPSQVPSTEGPFLAFFSRGFEVVGL